MDLSNVWRLCLALLALSLLIMAEDDDSGAKGKKKTTKKKKPKGTTTRDDRSTSGHSDDPNSGVSRTHGLIDEMLKGYDKQNSPHGENATIVKLGIYINSFYSISEQTMDYSVSIYLRQLWYEPRLAFTPQNNASEQMIKLEDGRWEQIWVPDVYFRNEKKASFHSVTIPNRLMRLYNNGKIWYAMRVSATLACSMMLHKYPLDTQKCPMMLESFGHTEHVVIFQFLNATVDGINPVGLDDTIDLPQFTLADQKLDSCSVNYSTGAYPCLMIRFILKRDIGYHLINVYVPSILIVILSWVAFWINIEAIPARVTLGLLTVLTMTTQSTGAQAQLPRVSYVKAIDVWMIMCLIFVFSALLEFAMVNVFSRKEIKIKTIVEETVPIGEINIVVENGKQRKTKKTVIPDPDGKTKARRIDKLSRRLFPMAFIIFNVVYWVMYLVF